MYSGESRGGIWPPIHGLAVENLFEGPRLVTGPYFASIFPEYVSDARLLGCPSNLTSELASYSASDASERLTSNPAWVDDSYAYLGWFFDAPYHAPVVAGAFPRLTAFANFIGTSITSSASEYDAQLLAGLDALVPVSMSTALQELRTRRIYDRDIEGVPLHPESQRPLGNGGGDTILRLRAGIERYIVTDINNPAQLARAAGETWVMFDTVTALSGSLWTNHAPGGCNVLYIDGHVGYVPLSPPKRDVARGIYSDAQAVPPVALDILLLIQGLRAP